MVRLRSIVAAAAAMLAAALAFVAWTPREPPFPVRHAVSMAPLAPQRRAEPLPSMADASAVGEPRAAEPPAKIAERLRAARDKRAFLDEAAKAGGGANLYFAMQAAAQCMQVRQWGMVGAEQNRAGRIAPDDPLYARRMAAYREYIAGCEGFEQRPPSREELNALYKRLYESRDAMGMAMAVKPYPANAQRYEDQRGTVAGLVATRDPYVIGQVVAWMAAHRAGDLTWDQLVKGDARKAVADAEAWAWRWALCDLGDDCTPTGDEGRRICFDFGLCEWKSIDEIAPTWFSATPAIRARRDEIVAAVRAGDWAKLGL